MPHITPAHLHVLLNHIPIIGLPMIGALLIWGLLRREDAVIRVALIGTILVAIGTWGVDLTGDPAIDDIRHADWFQRQVVHAHEAAGDKANILAIVAGIAALGTLVMARGGKPFSRTLGLVTLGLIVFAAMGAAWAGWEGGKIRHTEFGLTPAAVPDTSGPH
jgi:membrane-associated PAP2 superfamily phosphatase